MGRALRSGAAKASAQKRHAAPKLRATQKDNSRLLGNLRHHLMTRDVPVRDAAFCHPSSMADPYWCHRNDYYRITGGEGYADERSSAQMESVFEEGHSIHRKYQKWLWDMGVLRGVFECKVCADSWEDVSPALCSSCGSDFLRYREVPLFNAEYGIIGHADGDIVEGGPEQNDPLLEIKSLGQGTIRFEAPHLLRDYAHTVVDDGVEYSWIDLEGIWKDLRRPFPRHLRQGWLYLFLKDRQEMIFLYEAKWSQQTKEFVVRRNDEKIAPLLEACLDVQYAKEVGRPPDRPPWAVGADGKVCKSCVYRATCWGVSDAKESSKDEESSRRHDVGKPRSKSNSREAAYLSADPTPRRKARATERSNDVDGRRSNGAVRPPNSLAGLLRRTSSDRRD